MYPKKYFMSADFIQSNEYQQPKINPLVTVYLSNNYPVTCALCTPPAKPQYVSNCNLPSCFNLSETEVQSKPAATAMSCMACNTPSSMFFKPQT